MVNIKGKNIKYARLLSDWTDQNGEEIEPDDMGDFNIDHVFESANPPLPPRNYSLTNLQPIERMTDRCRPRKRPSMKRPAARIHPPPSNKNSLGLAEGLGTVSF